MMKRYRPAITMILLLVIAVSLACWAVFEGRRQQRETAAVLASQAVILARSLGTGLETAAIAAREFEDSAATRVLQNARLLGELHAAGELTEELAGFLAEQNEISSIHLVGPGRNRRRLAGGMVSEDILRQAEAVLSGEADELLLDVDPEEGDEDLAAVVRAATGQALIVSVHAGVARTYTVATGVDHLLRRLVGSGDVLYLEYTMIPGDLVLKASWDNGPLPPATEANGLRTVRSRDIFEVVVPIGAPAGYKASLRVGLEGRPLVEASSAAVRRTTLVGIVLLIFSLALAGIALLIRSRALEREEAGRKLAKAETARRSSERLAAAGALTAGLAHEVRSPLNAIGLAAQRIERRHEDGERCGRFAKKIRSEIGRLEAILRDFLQLAGPVGKTRKYTDIHRLAGEVVDLLAAEAAQTGVFLRLEGGPVRATVDPESIRRSFINLVRNAVQASPPDGEVRIAVKRQEHEVVIGVSDDGPGPDTELGDRVFDAFVTSHAGGTGLGLALVRRVAEEHHGSVTLRGIDGAGALAELRLPASPPEKANDHVT